MAKRVLTVLLVGALILAGIVWRDEVVDGASAVADTVSGWSTTLRDLAAAEPETEVGLRSVTGESASVLVSLGDDADSAAFLLLVSDPTGPPVALVLPQDLLADVPGFGEFRLVDALEFGGAELVALAVTNEFGLRIDAVASLPPGAIASGLIGPVVVDLSAPLFVEAADGAIDRSLPAGQTEVAPALVEELLTTEGAGDAFEWLQRQGSAWKAVFEEIAAAPVVADRITSNAIAGGQGAADLLVTVAGDAERILATVPVTATESATGHRGLLPSDDGDFIRSRFDHLLLIPAGRPRVEVLNGNGRVGTTADISARLVRAGYRIVRTDNADDFDYVDTLIVAQGEHAEGWAREILELLGKGLLFLEVQAPSGVVDVSIIVGQDIPAGEG